MAEIFTLWASACSFILIIRYIVAINDCQQVAFIDNLTMCRGHNPFSQRQQSRPLKSEGEPALISVFAHSMHLKKPLLNVAASTQSNVNQDFLALASIVYTFHLPRNLLLSFVLNPVLGYRGKDTLSSEEKLGPWDPPRC